MHAWEPAPEHAGTLATMRRSKLMLAVAATGVPVGAVLIPLGQLERRAPGELVKDRPAYVICNSGNRSRAGAEILLDLRCGEAYNVDGGIRAWLQSGLPVEDYTQ